MTKENLMRFWRIYRIVVAISIGIAAICLMVSCVAIYLSGDHPFSREVVAEAFGPISIPVYLCLALIVVGFILHFFMESGENQKPTKKINRTTEPDEASVAAEQAEAKKLLVTRGVIGAVAICFFIYGLCTGGVADVLTKAINICTECIGLG